MAAAAFWWPATTARRSSIASRGCSRTSRCGCASASPPPSASTRTSGGRRRCVGWRRSTRKRSMTSDVRINLRCPDCGKAAGPLAGRPRCPGCGRLFAADAGVWDLLPAALGAEQSAEDALHAEAGLPTWRRLFYHKRHWLEWCDARWLPELVGPRTRAVLEIGGGL